jgi:hypothetical protein
VNENGQIPVVKIVAYLTEVVFRPCPASASGITPKVEPGQRSEAGMVLIGSPRAIMGMAQEHSKYWNLAI